MSHNIDAVIEDVDDVKEELDRNLRASLTTEMEALLATAIMHVENDADWRGNLITALQRDGVEHNRRGAYEWSLKVGPDGEIAPYAPIVEFGSGDRSDKKGPGAILPQRPHEYPIQYPYQSPSYVTEELVDNLAEWVKSKPITPKEGDPTPEELGLRIARSIVANGTYAHPYLRPAYRKHRRPLQQAARTAVKKATR